MTFRRNPLLIMFDFCTLYILAIISFAIFGIEIASGYVYLYGLIIVISVMAFMFRYNMYNRIWRYSSIGELVSVFRAVSYGSFVATVIYYIVIWDVIDPVPFLFIYQSSLLIIGGVRFVLRLSSDNYRKKGTGEFKVLIIGAGDSGTLVAKELKQNKHVNNSYIVGFIDDDPRKQSRQISGLRVLGNRNAIGQIARKWEVNQIIIAIPSAEREDVSEIVKICKETNCELKIIPQIRDIIQGKVSISRMRNVEVQDLLGRSPVSIDLEGIANFVENKVVLVTGAGGSIGSELCRQIAPFKPEKLILLGHGENSIYQIDLELRKKFPGLHICPKIMDVKNREGIMDIFANDMPQVVFHAAAYKHVPLMESNPEQAVHNNIYGTINVAEASDRYGVERFVLISTDKAVNPTSVMGATKRVSEIIIQTIGLRSATKFSAVRFGNVLGSRGSVIPTFKSQIAEGGPVTVTHPDMTRYFMTIPEAAQLVIQAGAYTERAELFILDMGEPMNIYQLAKDLIRLSGFEPHKDIEIQFIGLRPGEKLYEELLTNDEKLSTTMNNRIFIGSPLTRDKDALLREINHLESIIRYNISEAKQYVEPQLKQVY
ncbi:MAG: nucleoside-diphosphate sugar epimerase/dehydratase [Candidatus Cohnella colombiensis]|uniref:Nucleoside-diphosphate sugar epimerase/dehydratase n=1 Tax=Candidatus Cohnella colombiensis TaxID=3121368 RepID=A0AA95JC88_9BACL|nr:MAG: nucleoside-diphosphate sugar epimerase/dehydratase [Cohnella sp.]